MGKNFGGRITMRTSDGQVFSLRGTLNLNTAGQSNTAQVNQDGTIDLIGKVEGRRFEFTHADQGLDFDALMKSGERTNVTFEEEFSGVTHYFTRTGWLGDPKQDRNTGEVSDFTGIAEAYNRSGS